MIKKFSEMPEAEIQLKRIQEKLNSLLKNYTNLQQENARLKEAVQSSREKNKADEQELERLKQQAEILKYANAEMSDEDKKEFEKRINSYLREIDRCIVMLGQ